MSSKKVELQEKEIDNLIEEKENDYEEEEDYQENESYHRYEPPKPKTKEELISICEQKITQCKERIEATHKTIMKHKRLANYHESNISIFMQIVQVYAKNQSRILYSGSDLEEAREIARRARGKVTLRKYTLIDQEKGAMELATEEFSRGRSLGIRISPFEDIVVADMIFKLKEKAVQPQGR